MWSYSITNTFFTFSDVFVWTTPRMASSEDRKATLCLIDILGSPAFDKKLKDKKSKKKRMERNS